MVKRVGLLSSFDGWDTHHHPLGVSLRRAGVQVEAIRLGDLRLAAGATSEPRIATADGRRKDPWNVDAILWRVSETWYLRCRGLLQALSEAYPVVNSAHCLHLCSDKWLTHVALARHGIPTVPTELLLPGAPVPDLGTPRTVIKPAFGAGGREVRFGSIGATIETSEASLAQPVIAASAAEHIRVLVCRGTPMVAFRRIPDTTRANDLLVNNVEAGGRAELTDLSQVAELASSASAAVGGTVVGVDLVPNPGNDGFMVLEINSVPGLEGASSVAGAALYERVAAEIVRSLDE